MANPPDRKAELADALIAVRERIRTACESAGRRPDEVTLLAVTKTFPASDVALLADLGLTEFAENRDAEAADKVATVAESRPRPRPRWHMVGRLQRNKARSVVRWADVVQSVDSVRLADALAKAVRAADRTEPAGPLEVLAQASIDADPARGGCPLPELPELADAIARHAELRLRGVMCVAPMSMPAETAFERLAVAAHRLRNDHPEATVISAGMSADLEAAIRCGSTCVRVGTSLLGRRQLAY